MTSAHFSLLGFCVSCRERAVLMLAPGRWWDHHPWRCSRVDVTLGDVVSGLGGGLKLSLGHLSGLSSLYDSMIV